MHANALKLLLPIVLFAWPIERAQAQQNAMVLTTKAGISRKFVLGEIQRMRFVQRNAINPGNRVKTSVRAIPNSSSKTIRFIAPSLATAANVEAQIWSSLGTLVAAKTLSANSNGEFDLHFGSNTPPAGAYTYTLRAGSVVEKGHFLLLRWSTGSIF